MKPMPLDSVLEHYLRYVMLPMDDVLRRHMRSTGDWLKIGSELTLYLGRGDLVRPMVPASVGVHASKELMEVIIPWLPSWREFRDERSRIHQIFLQLKGSLSGTELQWDNALPDYFDIRVDVRRTPDILTAPELYPERAHKFFHQLQPRLDRALRYKLLCTT